MNLTVFLHGNPGSSGDFDVLTSALGARPGDSFIPTRPRRGTSLAALIRDLDAEVAAHEPERLSIVAYSWGSYLALMYALRGARKPDELFLVNPYLIAENPISAVTPIVLGVPVLGAAILRKSQDKFARSFVENTFRPLTELPSDARSMLARLSEPTLWRGAVHYKRLQQNEPLPFFSELPCPVVLIRGTEDTVSSWERHSLLWDNVRDAIETHEIAGAGHSLPWTHAAEVAQIIHDHRAN